MEGSGRSARERAWDCLILQTAARRLAESWPDWARVVSRYSMPAGEAWADAAAELERTLSVPERREMLDRLLTAMRQEIVQDLRSEIRGLADRRRPPEPGPPL
jgi:hypothetical protein